MTDKLLRFGKDLFTSIQKETRHVFIFKHMTKLVMIVSASGLDMSTTGSPHLAWQSLVTIICSLRFTLYCSLIKTCSHYELCFR